jgi:hypothetical protein
MFFKNKQKNNTPSSEKSFRVPRYNCVAKIEINGFEGEAVLTNINQAGFCMESRTYAAMLLGEHYIMRIKPEPAAKIPPFDLEVEVRWVQSSENKFNSGFRIVKAPVDRSFEKYIDYIKTLSNNLSA